MLIDAHSTCMILMHVREGCSISLASCFLDHINVEVGLFWIEEDMSEALVWPFDSLSGDITENEDED